MFHRAKSNFLISTLLSWLVSFLFTFFVGTTSGYSAPIKTLYANPDIFEDAISSANGRSIASYDVGGLIVPHHLLAVDVIAETFTVIERRTYGRVIVFSPDSHRTATNNISVTGRSFETALGETTPDPLGEFAVGNPSLSFDRHLFENEHGLHAILPFITQYIGDVPVLSIIIKSETTQVEIEELERKIVGIDSGNTLYILSADFSHFLPLERALLRDQETLNILSVGNWKHVNNLIEADHLDNLNGLLLMLRLQGGLRQQLVVLNNLNSQVYTRSRLASTTSYIAAVFHGPITSLSELSADICIVGDVFPGRNFDRYINSRAEWKALAHWILEHIPDCPLIINLEAVLTDKPVVGAPTSIHWARWKTAVSFLKDLGVVGISVANNHSMDLGLEFYEQMVTKLSDESFVVFEHGKPIRFRGATFFAFTEGTKINGKTTVGDVSFSALRAGGVAPPLIAFPHWGEEWRPTADFEQISLSNDLSALGVTGIFGSHPHVASQELFSDPAGMQIMLYSLGNFLFDQISPPASGKIVLLDVFEQGTFFTRIAEVRGYYSDMIGK